MAKSFSPLRQRESSRSLWKTSCVLLRRPVDCGRIHSQLCCLVCISDLYSVLDWNRNKGKILYSSFHCVLLTTGNFPAVFRLPITFVVPVYRTSFVLLHCTMHASVESRFRETPSLFRGLACSLWGITRDISMASIAAVAIDHPPEHQVVPAAPSTDPDSSPFS